MANASVMHEILYDAALIWQDGDMPKNGTAVWCLCKKQFVRARLLPAAITDFSSVKEKGAMNRQRHASGHEEVWVRELGKIAKNSLHRRRSQLVPNAGLMHEDGLTRSMEICACRPFHVVLRSKQVYVCRSCRLCSCLRSRWGGVGSA